MRYRRWALVAVVLLVVVVAIAAADRTPGPERDPSPEYELEIVRTPTGIELECHHGCGWMTLTGNCDPEFPNCSYVVTDRGIRVFPDPENPGRDASGN